MVNYVFFKHISNSSTLLCVRINITESWKKKNKQTNKQKQKQKHPTLTNHHTIFFFFFFYVDDIQFETHSAPFPWISFLARYNW